MRGIGATAWWLGSWLWRSDDVQSAVAGINDHKDHPCGFEV
jgi:hypothetical protein